MTDYVTRLSGVQSIRNASPVMQSDRVALFCTLVAAAPSFLDISREVCATGVLALIAAPVFLEWRARKRFLVADPLVFIGIAWILAITVPVYLPEYYKDRMWYVLAPDSIDEAARWMYRGWSAFCVAYWAMRLWVGTPPSRLTTLSDIREQVLLRRLVGIVGATGAFAYIVARGGQTASLTEDMAVADSTSLQILYLMRDMSYAYIFLYMFDSHRMRLERIDRILLYAVVFLLSVIALGSASKFTMMLMGAAWVMGQATDPTPDRLVKDIGAAVLSVVGITVISYFTAAYRGEIVIYGAAPEGASTLSVIGHQANMAVNAIEKLVRGDELRGFYQSGYDSSFILDRFAHLSSLAVFLETIGFHSPYEGALATLMAPVVAVIPSALFPDKVRYMTSGDFALMVGWTFGGISLSTPGSLFWAWGYGGIVAGMGGLGAFTAQSWARSIDVTSDSMIWRTVMIMTVINLLDVGTTFQMIVVPTTRFAILIVLMRWGTRIWLRGR